jgi:hypothetical protein
MEEFHRPFQLAVMAVMPLKPSVKESAKDTQPRDISPEKQEQRATAKTNTEVTFYLRGFWARVFDCILDVHRCHRHRHQTYSQGPRQSARASQREGEGNI